MRTSAQSARRETVLAGAVTAIVAAALLAVGPAPGDAAAHLYRTLLVQHGALVWDNYWYAGSYAYVPPGVPHHTATVGSQPCTLFYLYQPHEPTHGEHRDHRPGAPWGPA